MVNDKIKYKMNKYMFTQKINQILKTNVPLLSINSSNFTKEENILLFRKILVITCIGAMFFLAAFAQITIGAGIKTSLLPPEIAEKVPEVAIVDSFQNQENKANEAFLEGRELVALCFHHVDTSGTLSVETDQLKTIIMELSEKGYKFIDADDLLKYEAGIETAPEKMAMLTFDDGYVDNYITAAPILKEFGVKGTFFISTGTLGQKGYLTSGQVKAISDMGFAIGSHTVTHPNLSETDLVVVAKEFEKSKLDLEKLIEKPVLTMAYPGGEVNDGVVETAKKYYKLAFLATNIPEEKEDKLRIKRWGVFDYNWDLESIKANKQGF